MASKKSKGKASNSFLLLLLLCVFVILVAVASRQKRTFDVGRYIAKVKRVQILRNAKSKVLSVEQLSRSGEWGTLELKEIDGKTEFIILLTNAPENVEQPVGIYSGSCVAHEDMVYSLNSSFNGKSTTKLSVSFDELIALEPISLIVMKSKAEDGIGYACSQIELSD